MDLALGPPCDDWQHFLKVVELELRLASAGADDPSRQYAVNSTGTRIHTRSCGMVILTDGWTVEQVAQAGYVAFAKLLTADEARRWLSAKPSRRLCRVCRPVIPAAQEPECMIVDLAEYRRRRCS